jgi:hypothetical protein
MDLESAAFADNDDYLDAEMQGYSTTFLRAARYFCLALQQQPADNA